MREQSGKKFGLILLLVLIFVGAPGLGEADQLTVYARRDTSTETSERGIWAVRIRFNHPVFPTNLAESIRLTVDSKEEKFQLRLTDGTTTTARQASREFILVPLKAASRPTEVSIVVDKGLSDSSGRLLLKKQFAYQFLSHEKIVVTGISTFYRSSTDKGLTFHVSGPVAENELVPAVKVTPEVRDLSVVREEGWRFRITGDFEFGKDYVLKIAPMTVDKGSAVLVQQEFPFKGPGLKPEIQVRTNRSVVELLSRQLLPLTLSNVTKVRCRLTRVPPYLIPEAAQFALSGHGGVIVPLRERINKVQQTAKAAKISPVFLGESREDAEVFFAPEAKAHVFGYSLPLSFRKDPKKGGAVFAGLSDTDSRSAEETARLIQITDLSISYKTAAESLLIWITSIHTGEPVPDAEVMLFQEDGLRYFVGKTDKRGLLVVKDDDKFPAVGTGDKESRKTDQAVDLGTVQWIVAATDKDASGIKLESFRLQPYSVSQAKKAAERRLKKFRRTAGKRLHPPEAEVQEAAERSGYRTGSVFTERGVYKPGETVHFKFVSRAYEDHKIVAPAGEKVKVEITGPRDDVNYSKELTLGDFGSCYDSLKTEKYFPVGTYTVKVTGDRGGQERDTFSTTFMVQEFKRMRHFATLTVKKEQRPDTSYVGLKREEEFLTVEVAGQYFTGGPVKHGRVRWKASLVSVQNAVKELDGFSFGNEDSQTRFLESGESVLDSSGKLNLTIPLDPRLITGLYGVEISATVLDIDGEPATEVTTFNPRPKYLVGIGNHPGQVQSGYAASLKVIVADEGGKRVQSGKIEVSILEKKYFYSQKRDSDGKVNFLWEEGWTKTFGTSQELVKGEAPVQLQLNDPGDYLVSVSYVEGGKTYTSQTLFKVGWEDYDRWARNRREEGQVSGNEVLLSMNKKSYRAGESAVVEFHTPRPVKKCLVAIETAEILDYEVIDVKGMDGKYAFKIKEEYQPNVYVSVLAAAGRDGFPIYAVQADTDIPAVYFGYADVTVSSEREKLALEIDPGTTELKGRPGEKKTLAFKVTGMGGKGVVAEMAVCVVDEAVLALTKFRTPDLSPLTAFNLPLAVFTGDLRLDLISQDLYRMFSTRPLTGGGMGLGEVSPSLRKDFRPVAYYNPAVVTDNSGMAKVEFTLPDSTTAYRVYAVVCDKKVGFVSGQRNMVVTKEFFLEPSAPRFLVTGDRGAFPVTVTSKTKAKGLFTLKVESSKDLKARLTESEGSLEPWGRSVVKCDTEAVSGMDKGVLRFYGKFSGEGEAYDDGIEATFPILSRYLPVNRVTLGSFSERTEIPAVMPDVLKRLNPKDISSGDLKAYIVLSTTNWLRIAPGLKYLLHYPYGCIEQTSSGVIPLAGLRALVKAGIFPGVTSAQVDEFLGGGVERLLSMQTQSGGFSYWPGSLEDSWWGTMYATFALISSRDAGYEVPADRLDKALIFLRKGLLEKDEGDKYHGGAWTREMALYNLAMGNKLSREELAPFFENYDSVDEMRKALLLLAAKKIGYLPDARLKQLVEKLNPRLDTALTDYYNSSYRELAVCLLAALEIGGAGQKADKWTGLILSGLRPDGRWISTADTGWCLMVLSRYYKEKESTASQRVKVQLHYGQQKPVALTVTDTSMYVDLDPHALLDAGKITVESDSKRLVNYTLYLTYPDMVTDPGLLSKGFTLRKKMENLNGKEEIRVGDVVRVTLEIGLLDPALKYRTRGFEYLALEDPVPAGLVAINSELASEGQESEESKEGRGSYRDGFYDFTPTYSEFRDDGVRVFKNRAWGDTYRYSYLARAVIEGDFWMRSSRITLMYDPDLFGRTSGQKIKILPAEK